MGDDLKLEVQAGLKKHKGQWKKIAEEVEGVSYSWIAQVGREQYKSAPSYQRLQAVAQWLRSQGA